jgi:rSAM/selenodomain-associated transferase 1
MAKAPRQGTVKTRLSPPLTPDEATRMSIGFLRDTAESIAAVASQAPMVSGLVAYTPVGDESLFNGILPVDFELIAQRGDGFGERLLAACEDVLACGFSSVCLIDSDSPTVPPAAYLRTVDELARPGDRVVVGPTADGGYYLIGMKAAHRAVFERVAWSTASVYADTCERLRESGLELVELPLWYDVDDRESLDILKAELLAKMPPGFATLPGYPAPHTRDNLRNLNRSGSSAVLAEQVPADEKSKPPAEVSE